MQTTGSLTAPAERNYYAAADVLRILSVGLVAAFHIWQQSWLAPAIYVLGRYVDLTPLVRRGYMLVDVMLLLSGFLLYLPCAERARVGKPVLETGDFYVRRLLRILPSYLFAVFAALVFALIYGREPGSTALWKDLLAHLTFTHTFFRPTYVWSSLNVVLWTLAVEMQFYFLFPLVGRCFARRPYLTCTGMTALALAVRLWVLQLPDPTCWINQLPCMLDLYALGMLAAHLHVRRPVFRGQGILCVLGTLASLLGLFAVIRFQNPADHLALQQEQLLRRLPVAVLGAAFLWFGCGWGPRFSRIMGSRAVRFLSGISYNFYIWHQYLAVKLKVWHIPNYISEMPQRDEGIAWRRGYTWLCWGAALLAAVAVTYLLEKPLAARGREYLARYKNAKKRTLP